MLKQVLVRPAVYKKILLGYWIGSSVILFGYLYLVALDLGKSLPATLQAMPSLALVTIIAGLNLLLAADLWKISATDIESSFGTTTLEFKLCRGVTDLFLPTFQSTEVSPEADKRSRCAGNFLYAGHLTDTFCSLDQDQIGICKLTQCARMRLFPRSCILEHDYEHST